MGRRLHALKTAAPLAPPPLEHALQIPAVYKFV
jgi:hypothetical protein